MQRHSTARATYVLRSIVLPYIYPTPVALTASHPASVTSANHLSPKSKRYSTTARAGPHDSSAPACQRRYSTGSSRVEGRAGFSGGPKRVMHTSTKTAPSFHKVKGHDPPPQIRTASQRTRDYLELTASAPGNSGNAHAHSRARAAELSEQGGHSEIGGTMSSRAKTISMALRRIMRAYDPELASDVERGGDRSDRSKGKGRAQSGDGGDIDVDTVQRPDGAIRASSSTHSITSEPAAAPSSSSSAPTLSALSPSLDATTNPNLEPFPSSSQASIGHTSLTARSSLTSSSSSSPPFPPTISRLLSARYFRLAVFHLLQTPAYAVDGDLLRAVADYLEERNAGKLARRLRRGWEVASIRAEDGVSFGKSGDGIREASGSGPGDQVGDGPGAVDREPDAAQTKAYRGIRLWTDPTPRAEKKRLPTDHWRISNLPPVRPAPISSAPSSLHSDHDHDATHESLTRYYNAHLLWLLRRPTSAAVLPTTNLSPPGKWPAPAPNLIQLRRLLRTIAHLEAHCGFAPDAQTAMIVLRCWLRSAAPAPHRARTRAQTHHLDLDLDLDLGGQKRVYKDRHGQRKLADKLPSEHGLKKNELRGLFEFVSKLISKKYERAALGDTARARSPAGQAESGRSGEARTGLAAAIAHVNETSLHGTPQPQARGAEVNVEIRAGASGPVAREANGTCAEGTNAMREMDQPALERETEYRDHIRPFGRMMLRAMGGVGDKQGSQRVLGWMREQRKVLLGDEGGDD